MRLLLLHCTLLSLLCPGAWAQISGVRKAPELAFHLPGANDQLLSSYRGKVISLEFIHTTCVHCQHASQVQERLQQTYGGQGFQAIDIAINSNADLLVSNFAKDFHLTFPVGWTHPEQALAFLGFPTNKLYVIPQIVVIDRSGYVRAQTTIKGDDQQLDAIRAEKPLMSLVHSLLHEPRARRNTP